MSFSASWLALREPHDHAARAPALTKRLCAFLQRPTGAGPLQILDLACGSGSTLRYLAPRLRGPQHWSMVDNDENLLAVVAERAERAELTGPARPAGQALDPAIDAQTVRLDLAAGLNRLPLAGVDLVTASALLDLVSAHWLDRLVAAVSAGKPALLLALSYDGSMAWQPLLPDDRWVESLFNRHQLTDKGFGPALGPAAAAQAALRLGAAGFSVSQAASPWRLGAGDRALQRELAESMVAALADHFPADAARLRRWLGERIVMIDAGASTLRVGHADLLALPC